MGRDATGSDGQIKASAHLRQRSESRLMINTGGRFIKAIFTEAGSGLLSAAWWNSVSGMARKPEKKTKTADPATEAKPDAAGPVSSSGLVALLPPAPAAETTAATATCLPDGEAPTIVRAAAKPGQICTAPAKAMSTSGGALATRSLKMNISITSDANAAKTVKDAEPMLEDAFDTHLRSIEMAGLEPSGFYPRIQEQLTRRAEFVLGSEVENSVLITQLPFR